MLIQVRQPTPEQEQTYAQVRAWLDRVRAERAQTQPGAPFGAALAGPGALAGDSSTLAAHNGDTVTLLGLIAGRGA